MHKIPELDRKGLREFALVTSAIVVILFGLFIPWLFDLGWPKWPWILAAVLSLAGLIAPLALRPVYVGWMKFGILLSKITTPIVMGIVFYVVVTPIGLVRKVFADDAMARDLDDRDTYRVASKKRTPESMENPY